MRLRDVGVHVWNQICTVPVQCLNSCNLRHVCSVCVCVTFQLVHVATETQSTSHTYAIPVVLNEVYGASSLATFEGVYGIVNAYAIKETHFGQK